MEAIMEKGTIKTITTHYIDGAFVESHGREVVDIIKPTTGKVIARVTLGDESSIVLGNVTVCSEICRRFGGGSAGKSALSGKGRQSMHGMQIVQSRINTGDFASC